MWDKDGSSEVLHPISPGSLNFIPFRVERGRPTELSGTGRGYSGAFVVTHVEKPLHHIL